MTTKDERLHRLVKRLEKKGESYDEIQRIVEFEYDDNMYKKRRRKNVKHTTDRKHRKEKV